MSALVALFATSCSGGYLSPGKVVADSDGVFYTAMTEQGKIAVNKYNSGAVRYIALGDDPNSLAVSPCGKSLYVTCGGPAGTLRVLSLPEGKEQARIVMGHTPEGIAVSADGSRAWVANRFDGNVAVVDLAKGEVTAHIDVGREPRAVALSPDGTLLAVGNFLPDGRSTDEYVAAGAMLIDTRQNSVTADIKLENGGQSLRDVCFSDDGRYLYCSHVLSRYHAPITQLDRGWVNANALGIIDVREGALLAAVLLDDVDCGAANPNGMALHGHGGKLYVALSGVHELCELDLRGMHARIDSVRQGLYVDSYISSPGDISTHLAFADRFKRRIPLEGVYPVSVASAGNVVAVSTRFTPALEYLDAGNLEPAGKTIFANEKMDSPRRGELAFADASYCYQSWQSCISCHPDGRADNFNWDQMNDGIGNPKNTKSMLFAHVTPPSMITGIRASAGIAVRKGILHILMADPGEELARDIDNYLRALRPIQSPRLVDGKLSEAARRGKTLYEEARCGECHDGRYYTDRRLHNVGIGEDEYEGMAFDTPTLREVWRTAPYLFDGRAATMQEVLRKWNADDRHGVTSDLTDAQIGDLAEYVLSL